MIAIGLLCVPLCTANDICSQVNESDPVSGIIFRVLPTATARRTSQVFNRIHSPPAASKVAKLGIGHRLPPNSQDLIQHARCNSCILVGSFRSEACSSCRRPTSCSSAICPMQRKRVKQRCTDRRTDGQGGSNFHATLLCVYRSIRTLSLDCCIHSEPNERSNVICASFHPHPTHRSQPNLPL